MSRGAIDDSISQNLNALLTPAQAGFDPLSTSQRSTGLSSRRQINSTSCTNFKDKVLFPSWQARSDVLTFCAAVATAPDPDDPDAVMRQVEEAKSKERVIDDRLDPYSSRYFPTEARTEKLASIIRQERRVENIIRARTWGLVTERCSSEAIVDWNVAMDDWNRRNRNV